MSLYIYGRLACDASRRIQLFAELSSGASDAGTALHGGTLDQDESDLLSQYGLPKDAGIDFVLTTGVGDTDSVRLWTEAMEAGRGVLRAHGYANVSSLNYDRAAQLNLPADYYDTVGATRLGRVTRQILVAARCPAGAIALVDGGIERVIDGDPPALLEQIYRTFLVPWDCTPNCAFAWRAGLGPSTGTRQP